MYCVISIELMLEQKSTVSYMWDWNWDSGVLCRISRDKYYGYIEVDWRVSVGLVMGQ